METKISKFTEGAAEITVKGNKMLAVASGMNSKIFKQISLQQLLSSQGQLYSSGRLNPWKCEDSIEIEGELYFPGPWYQGKSLVDTNIDEKILLELAISFQLLTENEPSIDGISLSGIFITDKREILFFPPRLINFIHEHQTDDTTARLFQPYNHPDLAGEAGLSFTLAVFAYKMVTGRLPFDGATPTEIRDRIRNGKVVDAGLLGPGLKKIIAQTINNTLNKTTVSASLKDWISILTDWIDNGGFDSISEVSNREILSQGERAVLKSEKTYSRNTFLSRNWKTILVTIASAALIIGIAAGPIGNALAPPVTTGMTAEEVVNTYYQGIIDMDSAIMQDCVEGKAGKGDISEITNIYVISKVRSGYEGKTGLISAQDWNDGKITELKAGEQVFGIADLRISQIDSVSFTAEYIKWVPVISDDPDSQEILPPLKMVLTDTLTLDKKKDVWVIISIDRNWQEQN